MLGAKLMSEALPRYDHNFIVSVQTDDMVAANIISQLITLFNNGKIGAKIEYVGLIDYEEQNGSQNV